MIAAALAASRSSAWTIASALISCGSGSIAHSVPKNVRIVENDRKRCVALEAVHHRRRVGPPLLVAGDVVDHDRPPAFTDVVADRRLDLELVAGIQSELDLVEHLAGDPPLVGDPRDRREAHAGQSARLRHDRTKAVVIAQSNGFGGQRVPLHLPHAVFLARRPHVPQSVGSGQRFARLDAPQTADLDIARLPLHVEPAPAVAALR